MTCRIIRKSQCSYCKNKLYYRQYEAKIIIVETKKPPIGAIDLNIRKKKRCIITREYAICERCNARYTYSDSHYYYNSYSISRYYKYYSIHDNVELTPVIDIDMDFKLRVAQIVDKYQARGAVINCTINDKPLITNKHVRFTKMISFLSTTTQKIICFLLSFHRG